MKKQIGIIAAMYLVAASLFAGGAVHFSGTWVLDESKLPPAGDMPRMDAKKIVVHQEANLFSSDRYLSNPMMGDFTVTVKVTLDGKESTSVEEFGIRISTAAWSADSTVLTVKSTLKMSWEGEEREMKSTEIWSLEEDGSLKFDSTFETPMGPMQSVSYYKKSQ
ncbi:hypothetical protein JW906_14000 [bacterium]|nr:hypothetical protein [bacterium]